LKPNDYDRACASAKEGGVGFEASYKKMKIFTFFTFSEKEFLSNLVLKKRKKNIIFLV
jgi:hypothetical protein